MSEIKLSLSEIIEAINNHEATDDNKQVATVIIMDIFREKEQDEDPNR